MGYIDQIGISQNFIRKGIGTVLVKRAKELSPHGLLTDILIAPQLNQASLSFFSAQGFQEIGVMDIEGREGRPSLRTSVRIWLPLEGG
jgi:hypothetical protein